MFLKKKLSQIELYLSKRQYRTFVLDQNNFPSDNSSSDSDSDAQSEAGMRQKMSTMMTGKEKHLESLIKGTYKPVT